MTTPFPAKIHDLESPKIWRDNSLGLCYTGNQEFRKMIHMKGEITVEVKVRKKEEKLLADFDGESNDRGKYPDKSAHERIDGF